MNAQAISLDQRVLDEERRRAVGTLQHRCNAGLPLPLEEGDRARLTTLVGAYAAVHAALGDHVRDPPGARHQYALAVASAHAGGRPNGASVRVESRSALLHEVREWLRGEQDLEAFLGALNAGAEESLRDERYGDARATLASLRLRVEGVTYAPPGVAVARALDLPPAQPYAGNADLVATLAECGYGVSHFDGERNPLLDELAIPTRVYIHGPPGTGKTLGVRLAYRAFKEEYEPGMACAWSLHELSGAFRSSLFGESVRALNDYFAVLKKGPGAVLALLDDADALVHARSGATHSPEERNITKAFLEGLDDLHYAGRGNVLVTTISNYPGSLDPALQSRLAEAVVHAPGPRTVAEYAALFRGLLAAPAERGYVAVEDWGAVGEAAMAASFARSEPSYLTGRQARAVTSTLARGLLARCRATGRVLDAAERHALLAADPLDENAVIGAISRYAAAANGQ